jgi:hypothetical protein
MLQDPLPKAGGFCVDRFVIVNVGTCQFSQQFPQQYYQLKVVLFSMSQLLFPTMEEAKSIHFMQISLCSLELEAARRIFPDLAFETDNNSHV